MKFIKKLSDWRIWLFTILPIILLAYFMGVIIYCYVKSSYNIALIFSAQVLFIVTVLLMSGDLIFLRIKQKHYVRGIAAIVLMLCFLGLQIAAMVMTPELIELSKEEQNAYQIYQETSYDDAAHAERRDTWLEVRRKAHNLQFTLQFLNYGSLIAFPLVRICCPPAKQKNDDADKESGNDIKI